MRYQFDKEKVLLPEQIIHVDTDIKAIELSKYLKSIKVLLANGNEWNTNESAWKYGEDTGYIPSTGQIGNVTLAKKYKVVSFESVLIRLNNKGIRRVLNPKLMTSLKRKVEPINEIHPDEIVSGSWIDGFILTEDNSIDIVPDCLKILKISNQDDYLFALAVQETLGFKPTTIANKDNSEKKHNARAFKDLLAQVNRPINERNYSKYGTFEYGCIKLNKYAVILTENRAVPYKECVILANEYSDYKITECNNGVAVLRNENYQGLVDLKNKECTSYDALISYLTEEKTTYHLKSIYDSTIKRLESDVKNHSTSLLDKVRELTEIKVKADNTPELSEDMILDGGWIKWYTPFLHFYAPSNEYDIEKVPLGRFEVKFQFTSNDIYFKNLTKTVNAYESGMNAPHVFSSTSACLGTFTPAIIQALGSSNIELFKQVVLSFLTNVNEEDYAGMRWAAWLEGSDRDNLCSCGMFLQGDENDDCDENDGGTVCELCGNENAEYSENYDGYLCEDCFNERFKYCEICDNEWIDINDSICNGCKQDYTWCDNCEKWIRNDDWNSDKDMCKSCYDDSYKICPKCNEEVSVDDYDLDKDLCNKCTNEESEERMPF